MIDHGNVTVRDNPSTFTHLFFSTHTHGKRWNQARNIVWENFILKIACDDFLR